MLLFQLNLEEGGGGSGIDIVTDIVDNIVTNIVTDITG